MPIRSIVNRRFEWPHAEDVAKRRRSGDFFKLD
jgi:hypothetical protein